MEGIKNIISRLPKKKAAPSERAELIGILTDALNVERKGKYSKLTYKRIGIMLSHLEVKDLYYLTSQLKDCRNRGYPFGKWFFWAMKKRPEERVIEVTREAKKGRKDT